MTDIAFSPLNDEECGTRKVPTLQERLDACSFNRRCAECEEPCPTWASLVASPIEGGAPVGVLCCSKCYVFHVQFGEEVCEVKSVRVGTDWTKAGVKALEQSGNRSVNKAYEAKLRDPVENKKCEKLHQYKAVNMQEFVEDKYKNRLLCNEGTYHHVKDRHGKHQKRTNGIMVNKGGELKTLPSTREIGRRRGGLKNAASFRHAKESCGPRSPPRKTKSDLGCKELGPSPTQSHDSVREDGIPRSSGHGRGKPKRSSSGRDVVGRRTTGPTEKSGLAHRIETEASEEFAGKANVKGEEIDGLSVHSEPEKLISASPSHGDQNQGKQGETDSPVSANRSEISSRDGAKIERRTKVGRALSSSSADEPIPRSSGQRRQKRRPQILKALSVSSRHHELPSSSGHGGQKRRPKMERAFSTSSVAKVDKIPTSSKHGGQRRSPRVDKTQTSSRANEGNGMPSSSGHEGQRRSRSRVTRNLSALPHNKHDGIPSSSSHVGQRRRPRVEKNHASGRAGGLKRVGSWQVHRTSHAHGLTEMERNEQGGKLFLERSVLSNAGARGRRSGLGKAASCRNVMRHPRDGLEKMRQEGFVQADEERPAGRQLRRRNSYLGGKVPPVAVPKGNGAQEKGPCDTLSRIAARRRGNHRFGHRGSTGDKLHGAANDDCCSGPEEREEDRRFPLVAVDISDAMEVGRLAGESDVSPGTSGEPGYGDDLREDTAEKDKKSKSWKMKLVKTGRKILRSNKLQPTVDVLPENAKTPTAMVA